MNSTNPKVSFIPKSSLVREESFLERPRPRSVMKILAVGTFVVSLSAYLGLWYYGKSLSDEIVLKTDQIRNTQKLFSDTPKVGEAMTFISRATLVRELLALHTVSSPMFTFIAENTPGNIYYNKFSFKNDAGTSVVELSGEAPTYAALAHQGDILRNKSEELSDVSIKQVGLTNSGTVTFDLTIKFAPGYLSYAKNLNVLKPKTPAGLGVGAATSSANVEAPIDKTYLPQATSTPLMEPVVPKSNPSQIEATSVTTKSAVPLKQQSALGSFWSKFKFW